jgi:hypothetical protein
MRWIGFIDGIESWEVKEFVKIVLQYKRLPDESEDDLVSALWGAHLPHIPYEAIAYQSETDQSAQNMNDSHMTPEQRGSAQRYDCKPVEKKHMDTSGRESLSVLTESGEVRGIDPLSIELTAQEVAGLKEMVAQEEGQDLTQEVFTMLVDILLIQGDRNFFSLIIDFFKEQLKESFVRAQFDISLKILKGLHSIRELCEEKRPWALPEIEQFFLSASSPESLELLREKWLGTDCQQLDHIEQIVLLLRPEAITTLGPMLLDDQSIPVKRMLIYVITSLAARDLGPLEALMRDSCEELLLQLIGVLEHVDGQRSVQLLLKMTRHQAERIRKVTLRTLLNHELWIPDKLFPMIEDHSASIRQMLLNYFGSRRCEVTEKLFIGYLKGRGLPNKDKEHFCACVRALGLCGSAQSIPFLQKALLGGNPVSRLLGSRTRQGAAIALKALEADEAQQVLMKAARSFYPGVRRAVRMAIQDVDNGRGM